MAEDGFTGRKGFILSCVGSSIGMGVLWRFPMLVSVWGGLTFIIPYIIFVILIAATGVMAEYALGRSMGSGPVGAFGKCTEMRFGKRRVGQAIGLIPVLGALALGIGYACITAWVIKYALMALDGELFALGQDYGVIVDTFASVSDAWGASIWIVIAIAVSGLIMIRGVSGGVEKANVVMIPLLFVTLVGLVIYISTIPGATSGFDYIFTLDMDLLSNPMLWIMAFGQSFFTLSAAGHTGVIYGSYLPKSESIPKSALYVATLDIIGSFIAAAVVIPAMAAGGAELNEGGPGLIFIYLVQVFNGMPMGQVVGAVFYICVLFAGLTSLISILEVPVAYLQERFRVSRAKSSVLVLLVACVFALLIQSIVSQWMDVASIYLCPLGALLAGVMFFWIAGRDHAEKAVSEGARKPIGRWFFPVGKYVYCLLTATVLILGALLGGIG